MTAVEVFIDSNILVYAHDRDAGEKFQKARKLIESLWLSRRVPAISIQVLQEMHVNLVRKGVSCETSVSTVSNYFGWRIIPNSESVLREAFQQQLRWGLSFWDASILAAARQAGATELWSEDFNTGQDYDGILAVNPL